jgi:surfeit locus 1 family protein
VCRGRRWHGSCAVTAPGESATLAGQRRSPLFIVVAGSVAVLFFGLFLALGTWQVQRRAWKLDLIARVEQRVHAPATPAPGPSQWPNVTAAMDEYRHVTATGTFLDASQTLVQAVTDLGPGYWVLTPLRAVDGSIVLVNRGFIPADDRNHVQPASVPLAGTRAGAAPANPALPNARSSGAPASGESVSPPSTITGLLRMTEPGGGFLRHNNPGGNQWYSRDVQAIAAAHGLTHVAPYFIDAAGPPRDAEDSTRDAEDSTRDAEQPAHDTDGFTPGADDPARNADGRVSNAAGPTPAVASDSSAMVTPVPGLTVIHFHNSHLVYAITWYTLALMTAIAIPLGLRKP